ncbi:MAG: hypothetical protein J2P38_04555 [Candidatus Dormibacteraeota bacterium]|nr:hypothetical protein [Candidatus Dormibacteraeota bacterium]
MDPAQALRDRERRLALQFGASQPPRALSGEDLECCDPRDARHWVGVYSELVEFMHGLLDCPPTGCAGDPAHTPDKVPDHLRAMTLQVSVLELHLAFWKDRLRRLTEGDER